jgi:hypothetical protein
MGVKGSANGLGRSRMRRVRGAGCAGACRGSWGVEVACSEQSWARPFCAGNVLRQRLHSYRSISISAGMNC